MHPILRTAILVTTLALLTAVGAWSPRQLCPHRAVCVELRSLGGG